MTKGNRFTMSLFSNRNKNSTRSANKSLAMTAPTLLVPTQRGFVPFLAKQDGIFATQSSGKPLAIVSGDSGMVTAYRPADYVKENQWGLIARITETWKRISGYTPSSLTTEQGSAGSASPATYQLTLYQQRYDRRAVIAECRQMFIDDARCRRSVQMFAGEAVRGGVNITVTTGGRGTTGQRARIAQEEARNIKKMVDPILASWATMLCIEGDLFVQGALILSGPNPRLVKAKKMPTAAMERLTDDADEFIDPMAAFAQVDVATNAEVATFPLALMYHARWDYIDGERYGEPAIVAGRRKRRLLELQEEAQAVRRMSRAPKRNLFQIGNKDNPMDEKAIIAFRERNGFVEGKKEIFDPANVAMDYFGNGLTSVQNIDSDSGVSDIADLQYAQNVLVSTAYPTPGVLFNLDAATVGQDVIDGVRGEWLKSTVALSDKMVEVVRFLYELALLVRGVHPDTVDYTIHFSESSMETPSDLVDRVLKLRRNIIGLGPTAQPDPLISKRLAIQHLSDIMDIDDVDAMINEINTELAEANKRQLGLAAEQFQQQKSQGLEMVKAGLSPSTNVAMQSSQGRGSFGQSAATTKQPVAGTKTSGNYNSAQSGSPSHTGPRNHDRPKNVSARNDDVPSEDPTPPQDPSPLYSIPQTTSGAGSLAGTWNEEYGMDPSNTQGNGA
jgi:hypothetical protein